LPSTFHLEGDLVVVDATVRLEGVVAGSGGVVGGALFIRPGAHINGVRAAAAGIIGTSRLAMTGATVVLPAAHRTELVRVGAESGGGGGRFRRPPPARSQGLFGGSVAGGDRVLGASIRLGCGRTFRGGQPNSSWRDVGGYHGALCAAGAVGEVRFDLGELIS